MLKEPLCMQEGKNITMESVYLRIPSEVLALVFMIMQSCCEDQDSDLEQLVLTVNIETVHLV